MKVNLVPERPLHGDDKSFSSSHMEGVHADARDTTCINRPARFSTQRQVGREGAKARKNNTR